MTNSNAYGAWVADLVRSKSQRLFGAMLRLICTEGGIKQYKLAQDSLDHIDYCIHRGWILQDEKIDVSQGTISKVVKGGAIPSIPQMIIWFSVIRRVYESDNFKRACRDLGIPERSFPKDLEINMYRLAHKGTAVEMVAAYKLYYKKVLELPEKWRNGIDPYEIIPTETDDNHYSTPQSQKNTDEIKSYVSPKEPISENYRLTDQEVQQMRQALARYSNPQAQH